MHSFQEASLETWVFFLQSKFLTNLRVLLMAHLYNTLQPTTAPQCVTFGNHRFCTKTENPEAIKNLVRFIVPQFFSYSIMWHMCPPSPHFVHIELKDEFQTEERKD